MSHTDRSRADPLSEGERIMGICNACRYCEGYCAVFPAMERRLSFAESDLNYLANLCHNCGECYYACQYAPPHEFAVNVPQTLAEIRARSYRKYAWPGALARAFERNGLIVSLVVVLVLACFLVVSGLLIGGGRLFTQVPAGDFYRIIPHTVMASTFSAVTLFIVIALAVGCLRFWRDSGERPSELARAPALALGLRDAFTLKNLHGGGAGCTYPDRHRSRWRRWFHHLTFYGFLFCFAATVTGTIYHFFLGWPAPYAYISLPVVFGILGGAGLLIGPAGLYWLKRGRDPVTADAEQDGMDIAFIALLWLTSLTGLLLLGLRETAVLGILLVIHLSAVMALFLTLPYGKFVHAIYRAAALVKSALEARRSGV